MIKSPLRIPGCNKHVVFQLFLVDQQGHGESWARGYYDHDVVIEIMRQYWSKLRVFTYCRTILLEGGKAIGWIGELTSRSPKFLEARHSF